MGFVLTSAHPNKARAFQGEVITAMSTEPKEKINPEDYAAPIYFTQGGGLVMQTDGDLIFIEAPEKVPELKVGDKMPSNWDYQPANTAARLACETRW